MSKTPASEKQPVSFLFLASHGLLSPVSALRWATNRLQHTDGTQLSQEQKRLIGYIRQQAGVLNDILGALFLLTRVEDKTYIPSPVAVPLNPILEERAEEWRRRNGKAVDLSLLEDATTLADERILREVLACVFAVFGTDGASDGGQTLSVEVTTQGRLLTIRFHYKMTVPFIQYVQTVQMDEHMHSLVGGTPGLFLSVAQSLLENTRGMIDMWEVGDGEYAVEMTVPAKGN